MDTGFVWHCKYFTELTAEEIYDILQLRSAVFVVEQNCVFLDIDGVDKTKLPLVLLPGKRAGSVLQADSTRHQLSRPNFNWSNSQRIIYPWQRYWQNNANTSHSNLSQFVWYNSCKNRSPTVSKKLV